ncbi:MAK10-like protein [Tanacetum coccineum]
MGDENPIRTLGDYSKPSHEGYRNTIELPVWNNVVPLRSDTIRLVQNGCSFYGLRSEDPNQHLKDFLKLVDSLDLDGENRERTRLRLFQFSLRDQASNWLERLPAGSISTWEDLTTRFLAQFFPSGRTAKLRNHILMFQQHHGESLSEAWTRPSPQPQALGTTFEVRVRDYMAVHTKSMERFENTIFKQREEINGRMIEMLGLIKELTTSRTPEKVLIREDAKFPVTKNMNSISLTKGDEEGSNRTKVTPDNAEKLTETETETPVMEITKKEDIGGNFEIPCSIGNLKHVNALVDQGSDVNVMPYSTYMKLTDKRPAKTDIRLSLASHSENKNRPFILGTPFLTTAKASIKFDTGTITLWSGKHKVSFHRIPDSSNVTDKGVENDIEPIAPTMTVNRLVLEWEEKIKLHLEREMQFNQWRSKNFKGMHLTLIATKEGMDDEGEVT